MPTRPRLPSETEVQRPPAGRGAGHRQPHYAIIAEALAHRIADGTLPPGTILRPQILADAFATSRVPATMALDRLAEGGTVTRIEGRGWRVGPAGGPPGGPDRPVDADSIAVTDAERSALRQRNWRDRFYAEIEEAIAGCLLFGRFQITSQGLAAHYGVSRTVAQECISRLERVGILRQEANGRWMAGPLDMRRIADLFELRRLLEPVALRRAAALQDRPLLARMRERVIAAQATQSTARPIPLRRIEHDLHGTVVLSCPNLDMREALHRSQLPLFSTYLSAIDFADMPDVRNMLASHLAVFDALLDGDVDAAAARLGDHLDEALADLPVRLARVDPRAGTVPPYMIPVPA